MAGPEKGGRPMTADTMESPTYHAERRARRLLTWGTLLATVGLIVLALDIMIKNAIVEAARDAHAQAEQLRQAANGLAAASSPGPGGPGPRLASVGPVASPPAGPGPHE